MKVGELLKHYRYNHYSNPDGLTDENEENPELAIKVDGTYYYIHENSLIDCNYVDCGLDEVINRNVDRFSQQINFVAGKLTHSLSILTER